MPAHRWGLLTNHALVLIHVVEHPRSTLRAIADAVGITDRATLSILRALEDDAIITREKKGRRNEYTVNIDALMNHRSAGPYSIGQVANALLALAGAVPGFELPPRMRVVRTGEAATVVERLADAGVAGPEQTGSTVVERLKSER
jgi:DNA-binding Lrp family transcriptional regulator